MVCLAFSLGLGFAQRGKRNRDEALRRLGPSKMSKTSRQAETFPNSAEAMFRSPAERDLMKRIIIAYDGSEWSNGAIEELSRVGFRDEAQVHVVAVADVLLPTNPDGPDATFPASLTPLGQRARAHALEILDEAKRLAQRGCARVKEGFPDWVTEPVAVADSPAWGIIKHAHEWRAGLIVLGSHGRSAFQRVFLGSVSHKVAAEAPCSVLIARHSHQCPPSRIVVAVDGSADSEHVLREITGRRWPQFAQFRVITVVDKRLETAVAWPTICTEEWVRETDESGREWVYRMIEQCSNVLSRAGLNAENYVYDGDPKEVLLRCVDEWQADYIFLGAQGLNHANRSSLGTVASAIAARAGCSVEMVRPGVPAHNAGKDTTAAAALAS